MRRRPAQVVATATLLRRTGDRTFIAALPNGKEIIAHVRTRETAKADTLTEGQTVRVELTTYDFSIGRISGL
ncbi:MAG TPA: hypothetical protein VHM91_03425 [Verrucomicrobiales bacterium]|jgi:translation initiation factor IF-1|nr:hypothetical protein [Verrucomicrobiales bacterium]